MIKMKDFIVWAIFFMVWITFDALAVGEDGIFAVGSPPFGEINTPNNNQVVRGTLEVTGWVLDDVKVDSVKIHRLDSGKWVYLGNGNLVEGARPDIAAAYSQYPYSNKAGWAFSLVTYYLPGGGSGSYTLRVLARDNEGNQVILGTRTINCDNINNIKPFGTFDTPAHGAVISGIQYFNKGWALTPPPSGIPTNGSTINVYIDGVYLGHPTYGIYRADIAGYFPGYANSSGAGGQFIIDTTAYADGVHTIKWTVTDTASNTGDIGSRYFTIRNGPTVTAPTVTTGTIGVISSTTASGSGEVTAGGGKPVTARGICWNTSGNPLTTDNKITAGTGTGTFTGTMTGLTMGTTYHVRAYATNAVGTSYGNNAMFTMLPGAPTVTTTAVSNITQTTAESGGNVTGESGAAITARGVCRSTSAYPTTADSTTIDGAGTGVFSSTMTGLIPGTTYHVRAYAVNSAGTFYGNDISFTTAAEAPEISLNRTRLNFAVIMGKTGTGGQSVSITDSGGGTWNWNAGVSDSWIQVTPSSGVGDAKVNVSIDAAGFTNAGEYLGSINIIDANAGSPQAQVAVYLWVKTKDLPPFGHIETPSDGSTVSGSIAVTGWALDDVEIANVKIYRNGVLAHEPDSVFIADAILVEGARPDVETKYPEYPKNYRAGWGRMVLTNFLPYNGNGTFEITAIAVDKSQNQVVLGSKTIICDNANSTKPFGSIDTPSQGGTISGSSFSHWGWVLTPQPNTVPRDGSTIKVWVDGVPLAGSPAYNIYRSDIAALMPGYNNSDGAGGHYYLDTTLYANGIHTISWSVTDDAGNSDGIGSRYFEIFNDLSASSTQSMASFPKKTCKNAVLSSSPVLLKRGYHINGTPRVLLPDENGIINLKIKQAERIEIDLKGLEKENDGNGCYFGYLLHEETQKTLPIGSFLDRARGIFYWEPGPGFRGNFVFVFMRRDARGGLTGKIVKMGVQ